MPVNQTEPRPGAESGTTPPLDLGRRFDVAIVGGSFAGMVLALALAQALGPSLSIALVDPALGRPAPKGADPRASAISAGSRHLLDVLGIWAAIAPDAEPVRRIDITDSSLDAGVRPILLTYENVLADGAWASHIAPNAVLSRALAAAVARTPQIALIGDAGTGLACDDFVARLTLAKGAAIAASVVVAADGRRSPLRDAVGIKLTHWSYPQTGIVTTITHEKPHGGVAVQHFLPAGPFALLPLPGNRSCITWSEERVRAEAIMALPDQDFLAEIDLRVAGRLGAISQAVGRGTWALEMHLARTYVAPRFALVGDAAHGVHPIAGQGLNLALRDVAALVECVAEAARLGFDLGSDAALQRYQRWRRFDSTLSASAFDALNRLFSNDAPLLRSTREFGLGMIDRIPALKNAFVGEAAGLTGDVPRLLRGLPI